MAVAAAARSIQYGKYVALNALMLGNLAAYTDFNYFNEAAPLRPLLHLWSESRSSSICSIHCSCWLCCAGGRRASFGPVTARGRIARRVRVRAHTLCRSPTSYLMPTRGWELGAGALLAGRLARTAQSDRERVGSRPCAGSPHRLHHRVCARNTLPRDFLRSLFALPPWCSSRAHGAGVNRLLAAGHSSGSASLPIQLYLWHVPVLVFFRYCLLHEPRAGELARAGALVVLPGDGELDTHRAACSHTPRAPFESFICVRGLTVAALLLGAGMVLWRSEGFRRTPALQVSSASHARKTATQRR